MIEIDISRGMMMNLPEKPKRDEKSKNDTASKRRFLLMLAAGLAVPALIVLVGIGLFIRDNMRACGCGDAYMTEVAIQAENGKLTATANAPQRVRTVDVSMVTAWENSRAGESTAVPVTATPAVPTATITPFNTATGVAQSMATMYAGETLTAQPTQCGMFWTSEESPEGTRKVLAVLDDAEIDGVGASLVIDSERDGCHVDAQGTAYPMSALPRLNLYIDSDDPDAIMLTIEAVLNTLDPRVYSYMLVDFTFGTDNHVHQMLYSAALDALKDGTLRERLFKPR